eukprot:m.36640 g.36640  ORF g.36640 m.36640 type:complete len:414 (+) comp32267_c0_seq1:174-1415(+)
MSSTKWHVEMTETNFSRVNPLFPARSSYTTATQMTSTAQASKPELSTPHKDRSNSITKSPRLTRLKQGLENIKSWGRSRHRKQSSRQRIIALNSPHSPTYLPSGGHDFEAASIASPHWCDQCGEFIWGIFSQPFRCKRCLFTCHRKCRVKVVLDCRGPLRFRAQMKAGMGEAAWDCSIGRESEDSEREGSPDPICLEDIHVEDLTKRINGYNEKAEPKMRLSTEGPFFSGTVEVHLMLDRPIHMLKSGRNPSQSADKGFDASTKRRCQSFFLPDDTVKSLFIDSDTMTLQVIGMLLEKFQVSDSPSKFALYETTKGKLKYGRKLSDKERPLVLSLLWSSEDDSQCFCLRDHKDDTINWNSFAAAELLNFLKMLEREEDLHMEKVRIRYREYRESLIGTIREKFIEMSEGGAAI